MSPDLPATAQLDPGLLGFAFLATVLLANLALIVWLHIRARRAAASHLDREQIARSARIAAARRREDALPWPLEHHDRIPVDRERIS